jgi:hypothetical protein
MFRLIFKPSLTGKTTMIFKRLFNVCIALCLLFAASCLAAERQVKLFDAIGGAVPVRLQKLKITSDISGGIAETVVRMEFYNPNPRVLEGQLQFPLAEEQRITGFSLDIDGKMRPAVPVEKDKGRQIFEAVERRRVDPALLETTAGNNFRLRVYPVPALGTRTVELKYTEALVRRDGQWQYRLPLDYAGQPQEFALELNVHGVAAVPQSDDKGLQFTRTADGYQARMMRSDWRPVAQIGLSLAAATEPQTFVQEFDGERFFLAEIPLAQAEQRVPRPAPKILGLLWDSSGSASGRRIDAELAELDRYFSVVRNIEVRLVRLRDRAEAPISFKVSDGNWSALRKALESTVYDGASALADWSPQPQVNEYLLVSDGLLNYGKAVFPTLAPSQRLYALNSAQSADTGRLAALAERSGGRLIQVRPDAPGAAAQELLNQAARVTAISAVGATELFAGAPDTRGGLLRVTGRLLDASAQVQVTVEDGGKQRSLSIPVGRDSPAHAFAAQYWADRKLHALEAEHEMRRAEIRRIGQRFGIPTRETSLIVLDTLQDYVRYDVTPPSQYLAAFEQMKAVLGSQIREKQSNHLEAVVRDFREKLAWWEKRYPKDAPGSKRGPEDKPQPVAMVMPAPAPAPMMAPPPVPAPVAAPSPAPAPVAVAARSAPQAKTSGELPQRVPAPAPAQEAVREAGITLKKWTPDAPYIARLKAASADQLYAMYLDEKPGYANSTAFFLDVADMLFERGQRDLALRVLSNLAEMELENRHVLRILGYRLLQAGEPRLAIPVLEKVRELAGEEPQSFRDLGLAYAAAGRKQEAVDQLYQVAQRAWDGRFAEIELIALAEMNAIAATTPGLDTSRIDPRLLKNMALDLRAVLTWDADNSDMDLWVTDPNGERCFFGNRFTYQGGRLSRDFTGGYGPEEFSLREAKPGKYKVEANFFGERQQVVAGATTLQVKLITHFGTPRAKEQTVTLRLQGRGDTVLVGEFEVKGD